MRAPESIAHVAIVRLAAFTLTEPVEAGSDGRMMLASATSLAITTTVRLRFLRPLACCLSLLGLVGCNAKGERPVFALLDAKQTGVAFANMIATNDSLNVQTDLSVQRRGRRRRRHRQ